jgi:hypothetical protein
MDNKNHTDKLMNKHELHRQTQTIPMTIKRTDKHIHVPQQQMCTTQENVSKSYFLYSRYYCM